MNLVVKIKYLISERALFLGLGAVLLLLALSKVAVLFGGFKLLGQTEALTGLTYRDFYILEITIETVVALVLWLGTDALIKHAAILAFVSAGLMYHLSRAILRIPETCGCLGGLTSMYPWLGRNEGRVAVAILLISGVWAALYFWKAPTEPSRASGA